MSKVRCSVCEHFDKGFCLKKKRNGKYVKVKENKSRTCKKYLEDSKAFFEKWRKDEKEKKRIRQLKLR